jgi:uridine kinase
VYCFESHTKKETEVVNPSPVIVIEGLFAPWDPRIRGLMDFRVFVEADPDLRFIRRIRRDIFERERTIESVLGPIFEFSSTYAPTLY